MIKTNKIKILEYLKGKKDIKASNISFKTGVKPTVLGVILSSMKKDNLVINSSFGKYTISDNGLKELHSFNTEAAVLATFFNEIEKMNSEKTGNHLNIKKNEDAESEILEEIVKLKKKYGSEKLFRIIDNIRKLID